MKKKNEPKKAIKNFTRSSINKTLFKKSLKANNVTLRSLNMS